MNVLGLSIERFIGNRPVTHMDDRTIWGNEGNTHRIHNRMFHFEKADLENTKLDPIFERLHRDDV